MCLRRESMISTLGIHASRARCALSVEPILSPTPASTMPCCTARLTDPQATLEFRRLITQCTLWLRGAMTVERFKITYNNGHEETIAAGRYRADGLWIIFEDEDKHEVHRLNERDVRSIVRENLSDVTGEMSA
jgi:hypothetical protein